MRTLPRAAPLDAAADEIGGSDWESAYAMARATCSGSCGQGYASAGVAAACAATAGRTTGPTGGTDPVLLGVGLVAGGALMGSESLVRASAWCSLLVGEGVAPLAPRLYDLGLSVVPSVALNQVQVHKASLRSAQRWWQNGLLRCRAAECLRLPRVH